MVRVSSVWNRKPVKFTPPWLGFQCLRQKNDDVRPATNYGETYLTLYTGVAPPRIVKIHHQAVFPSYIAVYPTMYPPKMPMKNPHYMPTAHENYIQLNPHWKRGSQICFPCRKFRQCSHAKSMTSQKLLFAWNAKDAASRLADCWSEEMDSCFLDW